MAAFKVVLRRRWFGEELEEKLAEYGHFPGAAELVKLARQHHLGAGATLHVLPLTGRGPHRQYTVRALAAGLTV